MQKPNVLTDRELVEQYESQVPDGSRIIVISTHLMNDSYESALDGGGETTDVVKKNLERGVKYTFVVHQGLVGCRALHDLKEAYGASDGFTCQVQVDADVFSMTASEIVVYSYGTENAIAFEQLRCDPEYKY